MPKSIKLKEGIDGKVEEVLLEILARSICSGKRNSTNDLPRTKALEVTASEMDRRPCC